MDWRTFIAECLKAIAWPAAIVCIVLLLRRPLGELLKLTKRMKYQEFEVEFERQISEVSEKIGTAGLPRRELPQFQKIRSRAIREPTLAVIDGWREVEEALIQFAKSRKFEVAPAVWTMPLVLNALLMGVGHLTQSQYDVISSLKSLRDHITHVPEFSVSAEEALKYVGLAEQTTAMLFDGPAAT